MSMICLSMAKVSSSKSPTSWSSLICFSTLAVPSTPSSVQAQVLVRSRRGTPLGCQSGTVPHHLALRDLCGLESAPRMPDAHLVLGRLPASHAHDRGSVLQE